MKIKIIASVVMTLFSAMLYAQLEVHTNNHVRIGATGGPPPTQQLHVMEDIWLRCQPASSGFYIENYTNSYGGGPFHEPSLIGQWGNSAWLGTPNSHTWQVYAHDIWYYGSLTYSSDSAFKTNVQNIESATEKLLLLRPVSYDQSAGITENTPEEKQTVIIEAGKGKMGLIAQELQDVYPKLVRENSNGELGVDYIQLIPVLIKAIQEQQAEIEYLKTQIEE